MKAILVIDIPDYLANKKLYFGSIEILKEDGSLYDTLVCLEPQPIRPMPQKKGRNYQGSIYAEGWNDCLNKIEGEEE